VYEAISVATAYAEEERVCPDERKSERYQPM
jgi:hypothetical protein